MIMVDAFLGLAMAYFHPTGGGLPRGSFAALQPDADVASSLLMSLWKVPAQPTTELMRYFYTSLFSGMTTSAASDEAQPGTEFLHGAGPNPLTGSTRVPRSSPSANRLRLMFAYTMSWAARSWRKLRFGMKLVSTTSRSRPPCQRECIYSF